MLGLHGWCSQTRKGQSEGGTEAAHPGACGMVGGMAGCLFQPTFHIYHFSHLDHKLSEASALNSFITTAHYLVKIDIQKYFWLYL